MNKILLIFSAVILGTTINAQVNWVEKATGFSEFGTINLQISFADVNNVWLIGDDQISSTNKLFSKSTDGGETWTPGNISILQSNTAIASLEPRSATTAYAALFSTAAGTTGGIWKTTDGGTSWVKQPTALFNGAGSFPAFVTFINDNDGVCVGDPDGGYFEIYTTNDGGNLWTRVPSSNIPAPMAGEYSYTRIFFKVGNTIWFGTTEGRLYKSIDGGLNWTVIQTPVNDFGGFNGGIANFAFSDQNNGLLVKDNHTFFSTVDGGSTWSAIFPIGAYRNREICVIPGLPNSYVQSGVNFISGSLGTSVTRDGGLNWTLLDDYATLNSVAFASPTVGLSATSSISATNSGVWKYIGASLGIENISLLKAITASPNPTQGSLNLTSLNIVQLEIYDLTGKQIMNNKYSSANEVNLNLSELLTGAYLVKVIDASGNSSTIKIIKE